MCVTYDFKLGREVTSLYILLQGICSPHPGFVPLLGMNIPDIPITDNTLPKSLSAPQTGYTPSPRKAHLDYQLHKVANQDGVLMTAVDRFNSLNYNVVLCIPHSTLRIWHEI